MRHFVLRPRAASDIDEIWTYSVERWGVERAHRYLGGIHAVIEKAAENPRLGRPSHSNYFKILAGSHVVIYRVLGEEIGIVRVLHQTTDIPRHL
jgi:toxin ParE1/3/4